VQAAGAGAEGGVFLAGCREPVPGFIRSGFTLTPFDKNIPCI